MDPVVEKPRFITIKKDSIKLNKKWHKIKDVANDAKGLVTSQQQFSVGSDIIGNTFNKLPLDYKFGVEIETHSGVFNKNEKGIVEIDFPLIAKPDGSIEGTEYNTRVLRGDEGLESLAKLMWVLKNTHTINDKCGLHVHLSNPSIPRTPDFFKAFYIAMSSIHDELFSLVNKTRRDNQYCRPIDDPHVVGSWGSMAHRLSKVWDITDLCLFNSNFSEGRNWLHTSLMRHSAHGKSTIEFRFHHGTLDFNEVYSWLLITMGATEFVNRNIAAIMANHKEYKLDINLNSIMSEVYSGKVLQYVLSSIEARKEKYK